MPLGARSHMIFFNLVWFGGVGFGGWVFARAVRVEGWEFRGE
jgi:hypothetical protein